MGRAYDMVQRQGRGWQAMATETRLFEAVITPHRSLTPAGLRLLLVAICMACGLSALGFWVIGAWPVAGFTGVELLLAAWLFRLNARAARASELLILTPEALRIIRTDPQGRREEHSLPPAWLGVRMQERPGRVPALLLASRGREEEVAAVLGEAEKRDLERALAAALDRLRHPVFDNPQLRD
jgi:uncharacterized membrane protein